MSDEHAKQVVLIVDDVPENTDMLAAILSVDYRTKVAFNGEKTIEMAHSDDPPDLILLDVVMPGMDGLEVCRRLKRDDKTKNIPVIFVSGNEEKTDEANGFEAGGVDYITKPVSIPIVTARVKTHLAIHDQNKTLEDKVAERTAQLEEAFNRLKTASIDSILRLSKAAEYKDDDTGVHVVRMSKYAAAVASQLALDGDFVETLLWAAPMHDIGKIGIPDRVLLKPGKLNNEEWAIMQRHCEMGSNILEGSDSDIIQLAETVARTHHEKWDGSGYPQKLKGENIPIEGRITAIADVFDALTSRRPYKEPFSVEKSFEILKEGKAKHFDPAVVDAFFEVESEILSIKAQFKEASIFPPGILTRLSE
ncbi:MAG: two-component system response regulator [Proteobacteria bacterium]|nr:two-component system response regulator [Pseudomonadota bacterium]